MAKNRKDGDQPESNSGNGDDSADNFGLPDIDYKPLEREQEEKRETEIASKTETYQETTTKVGNEDSGSEYDDDDEPKSKAPLFITLIIIVVVLVAGGLIVKYWYLPNKAKQEKELADKAAAEKKLKDEQARLAAERDAAERKRQDSINAANAKPLVGTIETLTAPTRRFYVVVTSDIDDDLVMDYAKKLSVKGVSSKMIPAFGNSKYYRLAIADFDTYNAAQSSADGSKGDYGNGVWVIRY